METRTVLPVRSAMAALALACGAVVAAQNSDFDALKAHWSFDEGRDWHNMPTPFKCDATFVDELTGKSDCLVINGKCEADNAAWVSGRQHAGMAPGVDRMIMILRGEENIREVIAFPMNGNAQDLLCGAPGEVTEQQLRETHIKIRQ